MKKFKIVAIVAVLFALFLLASCGEDPVPQENSIYISVSSSSLNFNEIGATHTLIASVKGELNEGTTLSWESTDEGVATCVDGVIRTVGFGTCIVKAKIDGVAYAPCTVTVTDPQPAVILSAEYLEFDKTGDTVDMSAKNAWGHPIDSDLMWKSSNRSVATFEDGRVVANGYGVCVLEAKSKNGASASCVVRVFAPDDPRVTLSQNRIEFSNVGEEVTLGALTMPSPSINVTWITTDASVATVYNGIVTGVGVGSCAIIAMIPGGVSAACSVSVGEEGNTLPKDVIDYDVQNLYQPVYMVDRKTSSIVSAYLPIGYRTEYTYDDADTIVVSTYVECVKIYDAGGAEAKSVLSFSASLYREKWEFCESYSYEFKDLAVGDSFEVRTERFGAGFESGTARWFRLVISRIRNR